MSHEDETAPRFFYKDYWGFKERPTTSPNSAGQLEEELFFISGMINASAADGKVTPVERNYIKGLMSVKGYLPEAVAKVDEMSDAAEKKSLEEIAEEAVKAVQIGTLKHAGPAMVLQAIKAAAQDGVDEKEMVAIEVIAEKMGISKEKLEDIKKVVADEEEVKKRRIALCVQDHPCLADEYKV